MMWEEFKMNSEKKVYCKPLMEVVEMDYGPSILECSGEGCVRIRFLDDSEETGDGE